MGAQINQIYSYHDHSTNYETNDQQGQVLALAKKVIDPFIAHGVPNNLSHILVATTCPDMLSPSLAQQIKEIYIDTFSNCLSLDIVQGCAGGITAMVLGSQISESHDSSVLVIKADAAKKATSKSTKIHRIFGNGSFSCLITKGTSHKRMIHYKTIQYKGLSKVVNVNLGHDADRIIMNGSKDLRTDPRKYLGLSLNRVLAIKLYQKAEQFYLDFIQESETPDILILHQVNPLIMKHLEFIFKKYKLHFVNVSDKTGNCGAASVGIALNFVKDSLENKKVMLCSFGTGGVITAGLWQF